MRLKTKGLLSLTGFLLMACANTEKTIPPQAVPCAEIERYVKQGFSPYCGDLASEPANDADNRCIPPETHFETMIPLYDLVEAVCGAS